MGAPAQHTINCKGWILEVVSLLLLAHDGPAADPEVHQAVSSIMSVLLFGKAESLGEENGAALGPATALVSVLEDLNSLSQCNLATSWLQCRARPHCFRQCAANYGVAGCLLHFTHLCS